MAEPDFSRPPCGQAGGTLPRPVHCRVGSTSILVGLSTGRRQNCCRVMVKKRKLPSGAGLHLGTSAFPGTEMQGENPHVPQSLPWLAPSLPSPDLGQRA